jgi:hypothetical protein
MGFARAQPIGYYGYGTNPSTSLRGALATKQSMPQHKESWIASLRSQ